jgi:hypothetical protein
VIFYLGDYVRQMEDIQRGDLDVGIVTTGFLEEYYPQLIDTFRYHNLQNATFQGEPFPFLTSTDVVPGYAIAAVGRVPWKLRRQVYEALSRLTENDPLCVNAEIGGFVAPVSNELSRVVATRSGVMIPTDEKTPQGHNRLDCHAPWDGYFEAISCPEGYFCDSEESVELSCERLKLHCPAGLHCVCRPCIQDMVLYMYPVQVLYPVAELFESANAFLCRALVTFISSIKFIGFLFNAFCTFHFDNVLGQQHAMSCSKLIFSPVSHDPYCSSSMTRSLVSHSRRRFSFP